MKKTLFLFTFLISALSHEAHSNENIPLQHFFCDSAMTGGQLSPDGKYFASMVPASGPKCAIEEIDDPQAARVLLVIDLETNTPKVLSGTRGKSRLTGFSWISNTRMIFNRGTDDGGLSGYSMWAINADGTKPKELVPGGLEDGYPTGVRQVLDRMKDDDKHILVTYNKRRPKYTDVYKLNVFSGKLTLIAKDPVIDGQTSLGWVTDDDGVVRGYTSVKGLYYYKYFRNSNDEEFKLIRKFKFQEPSWGISAFSDDPRYVYVRGQAVDKDGTVIDDSNTEALWLWDSYEDKFVEKIYENPKYDVGGIAISDVTKKPVYIYYYGEKPEKVWLDKELEAVYSSIEASFPNDQVSIGSWTDAEDAAIVTAWSDTNPGEMYYYDRNKGSIALIAKSRPWIKKEEMSPMLPISFTARDGLVVEGYLTVPKNSDGKNLPLIVNPHGGPAARDVWGYNPEHQFLASRGYAVLSMNFRGSTGYGRNHVKMANGQWGRKMQDDVTDSVNWAVEQGIADPDNVCIYGASYGGYAVMAGITKTPKMYKCAVNYVGVTDMGLLFSKMPKIWEIWEEQQKIEIGDYENDKEYLDAVSPINLVDRIETPLYIVHGVRDWRVPIQHAQKLRRELEKNGKVEGKDFWWMVKTDEGHGFYKEANKMELYSELEEFFGRYLKDS
tara:strand:- start:18 stop:2015 length:1998 start_codon:yes stop_codon:yes gene_type:complete